MKFDVAYDLDMLLRNEIVQVRNLILKSIDECEIYLFGSFAKGKIKSTSDIDLLILVNQDIDKKDLRILRHSLEDSIESLHVSRNVDLKLYSKNNYDYLAKLTNFESSIKYDLIDIKRW